MPLYCEETDRSEHRQKVRELSIRVPEQEEKRMR
ncbi:hypothetical protein RUMOBE_00385 [Blautia obeum ATCC 29174]|uniref:Uncharacterized protein n=1 Tax=Blautia obeum ATCC 29174 TaxID=411459 RepID=A5ZN18_9FIRM|nr:hypothetical protein RUMOBE_00385 [Blautia obeum ATCC 29174]